jgi:ABC-2 type transport system ATP-binding protein
MLELIRRTGTEFGIAIVMASHLLGEIERVCDYLVAIDAGRLLQAAALGTFTRQTGTLMVEVDEGPDAMAARLEGLGLAVGVDGHHVLVEIRDEETFDAVRDAAADLGLGLVRLQPRRGRLEDLFRETTATEVPGARVRPGGEAGDGSAVARDHQGRAGDGSAGAGDRGDPDMPTGQSSGRAA